MKKEEYADVIAYLLKLNNFPGRRDRPADRQGRAQRDPDGKAVITRSIARNAIATAALQSPNTTTPIAPHSAFLTNARSHRRDRELRFERHRHQHVTGDRERRRAARRRSRSRAAACSADEPAPGASAVRTGSPSDTPRRRAGTRMPVSERVPPWAIAHGPNITTRTGTTASGAMAIAASVRIIPRWSDRSWSRCARPGWQGSRPWSRARAPWLRPARCRRNRSCRR